eukprot:s36_g56.t1
MRLVDLQKVIENEALDFGLFSNRDLCAFEQVTCCYIRRLCTPRLWTVRTVSLALFGMFECCKFNEDIAVEVTSVAQVPYQTLDPLNGLVITFQQPDSGGSKDVLFKEKPLGLEFKKSIPLTVNRVRDVPEVQCGWIVTHLQGEEIATDLKEATIQLIRHVKDLPVRQHKAVERS